MLLGKRPLRASFLVGAVLGIVIGSVAVRSGRLDVFFTPWWQQILLYPGLAGGWAFYNCCNTWFSDPSTGADASLFVGLLAMAAGYGLAAMAFSAGWSWLRRRIAARHD